MQHNYNIHTMINQRLVVAVSFFVFFIQADLLALAQIVCENNNGNYTSDSAYSANLNATLSSLSTNIGSDGFYNASAGEGTDRVDVIAMCRGDVQLDTCRGCVQKAGAELLTSCPNQMQAIIWEGSCTLRYSNASIYGVLSTYPTYYVWNTENVTSPEQFKANLQVLLNDLRRKATAPAGGSPRKMAAGEANGPDFQTIFGLLQCTLDMSLEECSSCLASAISEVPKCCEAKTGGRVVAPSCILLFGTTLFFNETRLQELEFPPPPQPQPQPPPPTLPPPPAPVPEPKKKSSSTTRIIIIIVAVVVGCLILAVSAIIFLRKRNKHTPTEIPQSVDEISTAESLQYAFSTIKAATNDFSDHNKLGQGGFGIVYKGNLSNGREIAVKRLSMDSGQGDLEFKNEVLLLAKLQHRNLVRLLGFAIQGMEKLLIYEFVQNASLDHFIFVLANRSNLDWDRRYKIIGGIARGILYLHEDSRLRIIHRDLKASNILLDGEMSPKIADFGMARLFRQDETHANTSRVVGTYGYMPPEYLMHGQFSIKSDVFSFGVLVLEIISGQSNNAFRSRERVEDLVIFAWRSLKQGRGADVVDPFLRSGSGSMNEMLRCIHIGLLCVQEEAVHRPTMASVVLMLSSFSMSLDLPLAPAFYASDPSFTQQEESYNNSTNSKHEKSPGPAQHQSQLQPR